MTSEKPVTVLERIASDNVFTIIKFKDKFVICESCDFYYSIDLTKDEMQQLITELIQLIGDE